MTDSKAKSTRRSFFLHGGAVLGAGVAGTAAARSVMADPTPAVTRELQELRQQLESREDREAIRQLHLEFTNAMETQAYAAAADLFCDPTQLRLSGLTDRHTAYRQTATQRRDVVTLSDDRLQAAAIFHTDVRISTPLQGDSTLVQMARLQGQVARLHWESGRFEAQYVKVQGHWKMASLRYSAS